MKPTPTPTPTPIPVRAPDERPEWLELVAAADFIDACGSVDAILRVIGSSTFCTGTYFATEIGP